MNQKTLSRWLKAVLFGIGICGILLYALVFPSLGETAVSRYPEFAYCRWPWLALIWVTALPCFAALLLSWKIAENIGEDRSFSHANASLLKWIALLLASDAALFFLGNLIFWLLGMNHPAVLLLSFLIEFFGVAVSVAAAALSHLVRKAAVLQDENDLTI